MTCTSQTSPTWVYASYVTLCLTRSSNTRKPNLGRAQPKCSYGFGVLRKTSMVLQDAPHSFSGTSGCFTELLWGCTMLHKAVLKTFKVFYRGFRMSRIASMRQTSGCMKQNSSKASGRLAELRYVIWMLRKVSVNYSKSTLFSY